MVALVLRLIQQQEQPEAFHAQRAVGFTLLFLGAAVGGGWPA
jgi:hypothetical protein